MEVWEGSSLEGSKASAPCPKPLGEAVAGLVKVLGVPALQESLRLNYYADLAALGTAIGFPLDPAVNHAMLALWQGLQLEEDPVDSWMADLPDKLAGFDLESATLPTLKALCMACSLFPDTDNGAELQSRLRDLLPLLPQHIPLAVAVLVQPDLVETCRRNERRWKLKRALAARGLELRADSRLCEDFITHGNGVVASIVEIMEQMSFYYKCTTYSSEYEKIKMQYSYPLAANYGDYDDDESGDGYSSFDDDDDDDLYGDRYYRPCYTRRYTPRYDPSEVSRQAKEQALSKWVANKQKQAGATLEQCLAAPELPSSLHPAVTRLWRG